MKDNERTGEKKKRVGCECCQQSLFALVSPPKGVATKEPSCTPWATCPSSPVLHDVCTMNSRVTFTWGQKGTCDWCRSPQPFLCMKPYLIGTN